MFCFNLGRNGREDEDDEEYGHTFGLGIRLPVKNVMSTSNQKTTGEVEKIVNSDKVLKKVNTTILKAKDLLEHSHEGNRGCSKMVWKKAEYRRLMKNIQSNISITYNCGELNDVDTWELERHLLAHSVALTRLIHKMEISVSKCKFKKSIAHRISVTPEKIYPNLEKLKEDLENLDEIIYSVRLQNECNTTECTIN